MAEHIATSPLTGRIHSGRVNKAGNAFVGEKRDVTSDVLRAVIEKADFHGGSFDIEGGGRKWLVTVTEATAAAAPSPTPQPETGASYPPTDETLHDALVEWYQQSDGITVGIPAELLNELVKRLASPTPQQEGEATVQAIAGHIDGWRSATYGYQGDDDPAIEAQNKAAAEKAHAAECLRRIRAALAASREGGKTP
jgi:hypothetical protein